MIKVLLYEDNPQLREGLTMLIDGSDGFTVLASYKNCDNVTDEVKAWNPDVILMDIDMPGTNGIEGLKLIRSQNSTVKILMLTVFDDNKNVFDAIRNGANGYILKKSSPAKLLDAISELVDGGAPMSSQIAMKVVTAFKDLPVQEAIAPTSQADDIAILSRREKEILEWLAQGKIYKEIGKELNISAETVRKHVYHIYEKLHVNNRVEAVNKFYGR